ncbi:hypothetical protein GCM10027277_33290 [Pseudoduganella ginsengisoli]|uniref:SGNH hydrolase-type esterase domain-containing protein n=1 Tax=Pseudoduganella ginsengisoli TaxID=1462440 RepID=A0A6L6Q782_9BURK|nr:SGNH/GDSL hydrolase family protein [Pseudoduganella ginsengisoli]MTW05314.1 hypothetical protein [Pseudoduganella ginsengisoli]
MDMLVLGDSVTWGQGLALDQKFCTLLYQARYKRAPVLNRDMAILAHSGAIIGVDGAPNRKQAHGEVPSPYPSILTQCDMFKGQLAEEAIVIVNGGINDIDPFNIVDPRTSSARLDDMIEERCYKDMVTLLTQVAKKFKGDKVQIVVPGYFPILSAKSDPARLPHFLSAAVGLDISHMLGLGLNFGVNLQLNPALLNPPLLHGHLWSKVIANCHLFFDKSTVCLRRAVNDVNTVLGGHRVRFASVPFKDENAALASDAWLWGVDLTPPIAQDPERVNRFAACNIDEKNLLRLPVCYCASAGHPNDIGAQQYLSAMLQVVTPLSKP